MFSASAAQAPSEYVTFLDYDNTIFPTFDFAQRGIQVSPRVKPDLDEETTRLFTVLQRVLCDYIAKALTYGKVVIVTNAMAGWVHLTIDQFMPHLKTLMLLVEIVSAQDLYKPYYPNNPEMWKLCAFQDKLCEYNHRAHHFIGLGDASNDHHCLRTAVEQAQIDHPHLVKTVKFAEHPNFFQIIQQLETALSAVEELLQFPYNADLCLVSSP